MVLIVQILPGGGGVLQRNELFKQYYKHLPLFIDILFSCKQMYFLLLKLRLA